MILWSRSLLAKSEKELAKLSEKYKTDPEKTTTKLSLYKKGNIDYSVEKATLCSRNILSGDAWLVYRFNEEINAINDEFYKADLPLSSVFNLFMHIYSILPFK